MLHVVSTLGLSAVVLTTIGAVRAIYLLLHLARARLY